MMLDTILDILRNILLDYWYFCLAFVFLSGLNFIYELEKEKKEMTPGQRTLAFFLSQLPKDNYRVLNNIFLKGPDGPYKIDHLLVSTYGVFIIANRDYRGEVYGGELSKSWTQNLCGKRFNLANPLEDNREKISFLKDLHPSFKEHIDFISLVAVSGQCQLKNRLDNVTNYRGILRLIKSYKKPLYSRSDVSSIYGFLKKKSRLDTRKVKSRKKNFLARPSKKTVS